MMAELLVELFSEEIPARMQARAADDLKRLVTDALKAANLSFDAAQAYATPRRLALAVGGLPTQQPDVTEEKKGPKYGAPAQAVQGFMKANGIKSLDKEAELRETDKGPFYFIVRKVAGRPSAEVLAEILSKTFAELPWPKSMRWAGDSQRWVRPLHGIVAVFDGKPLTGAFAMGEERAITFGNATQGHRFLAPDAFTVTSFADYRDKLLKAKVVLDPAERRATIAGQAAALAKGAGVTVKDDAGLLDEVTGLVEWPQVLMGRIGETFMDLPGEVLSTSMRSHQKYFSTEKPDGGLADRFLFVANMEAPDGSERAKTIVAGNERVLRARLADARFFWDQDREKPLSARVPALKDIVFHAKLGTVADKVSRLESLAAEISKYVPGADRDEARSAARLAKADLTTGMVGEFPELQGIMGRWYALKQGVDEVVADAIRDHYLPRGASDAVPSAVPSARLAVAERADALVGCFGIGLVPSGSADPFALRRATIGILRIALEGPIDVDVRATLAAAHAAYRAQDKPVKGEAEVLSALDEFFRGRLRAFLTERHPTDLVDACLAAWGGGSLRDLRARLDALEAFRALPAYESLAVAFKRAYNIAKDVDVAPVDAALLAEDAEKALAERWAAVEPRVAASTEAGDYQTALTLVAEELREPIDRFFDEVFVMVEDEALRTNRLRLLAGIAHTLTDIAHFHLLGGQG